MFKFLFLSVFLFFVGVMGLIFTKKHIILLLLAIELIFLSININFFVFSVFLDDIFGQIFVFFIVTIAAAESAIGLAILVVYYRLRGGISVDLISLLKG